MGNQTTTQNQSAFPYTPSWLTGYYSGGANQAQGAQASLPNLSQIYGQFPTLQTAQLTPAEQSTISQFSQNTGTNPYTSTGAKSLESFLGTPGTPSAATNAALKEFNDLQAPAIMQQAALNGTANGGAALQALTQGQEAALVPFLQQDQANTLNAATTLGSLGQNQQQITGQQLQNTLQAQDLPRQIQQQGFQNIFDQLTNKLNYAQGIQTGPLQNFSSLIGQIQNAKSSANQPKF